MGLNASYIGQVISLDETQSKKRAKVQMLRTGDWYHPKAPNQRLNITDETILEFTDNFKKAIKGPQLPTNDNHDDPEFRRSLAWIVDMVPSPGKLDAVVEFADDSLYEDVKSGKVKYFSPEIQFDWLNPEDKKRYNVIKGAAWTNIPYLKGMNPAEVINLCEILETDEKLCDEMQKEPKARFKDAVEHLWKDVTDLGHEDECTWRFSREQFQKRFDDLLSMKGTKDKSKFIWCWNQLDVLTTSELSDMKKRFPDLTGSIQEVEGRMKSALNDLMAITYRDEVKLADMGGQTNVDDRRLKNNTSPDEDDNDRNNVDTDREADQDDELNKTNALDPDAQDPSIPAQCNSCTKLQEGTCPFQGINVKMAAAGDGNCPQYVSTQAQLAPRGDGSDVSGDDGHVGGSGVNFSEHKEESMPGENEPQVNLAEFQVLQTQVTSLSETLQNVVTENQDLKSKLNDSEKRRQEAQATAFADRYLTTGKITPAQHTIVLSMLAIERGDTDVKLSDGETSASIETLLSELLEANETQISLNNENVTEDVPGRPNSRSANLSEHEALGSKFEARAKEIAAAEGGPWTNHYSRAAREITAEQTKAKRGAQ
jgi:hypothetical protein